MLKALKAVTRWRLWLPALALTLSAGRGSSQQVAKVRAVLFFSPTCPHCQQVMTEDLPPLVQEFGDRLQIVTISVMSEAGQQLYLETVAALRIPDERTGVPTLLVGNTVLVGASEIPARFPAMVREALAGSGVDWPTVPGIRDLLRAQGLIETRTAESAAAPAPAESAAAGPEATSASEPPVSSAAAAQNSAPVAGVGQLGATGASEHGMLARFRADPRGNAVAVAVLFVMLLALLAVMLAVTGRLSWRAGPEWLVPVLAALGLGVALYLAYVELTGAPAVCGPVGDCHTVQQSPYARIGGVLPVGVLGAIGYLLVLALWVLALAGPPARRPLARELLWDATLLGTVFSVWLTFLEPFVIGATCAWCVTSALLMTALLLQSTPAALAGRAPTRAPAGAQ